MGVTTDLVATFGTRQKEPEVVAVLPWLRLVGL